MIRYSRAAHERNLTVEQQEISMRTIVPSTQHVQSQGMISIHTPTGGNERGEV
jgi:hypothetical protein